MAEMMVGVVALGSLAGCTPAPEPATTPRPSEDVAPPVVSPSASVSASAAPVASSTASAAAPQVVAPPPMFPEPMVTIPRGWFTMGCPKSADPVCGDEEKPRHRVVLSPYEIDSYEVTVGHYKACMDAGACKYMGGLEDPEAAQCREQFRPERSKLPMVCVSMGLAQQYCEWRDKRLPTEAEWERAARGDSSSKDGGARLFPWGEKPPNPELACVQTDVRCEVGSHPAGISPYGLHDMAGNAAEWVWDFFDPKFYASSPVRDPDGTWDLLPIHRQRCDSKVCWTVRGGSWRDEPLALRSTARTAKSTADSRVWSFDSIGFRCARSTEASRREYFANRTNIWNAKRVHDADKWLKR
jgi:formylglycine-generating enzyme required for sulfatase activity